MATKPKAAPAKPAAKKAASGTAVTIAKKVDLPANYEEQKQNAMAAFKSRLAVAETNRIAVTQDKKFKLPADGESVKVDSVSGIIVDFCAHKRWYETDYNRDNPVPPNCFAVGFAAHDSLSPSDNSPEIQSEACRGCLKNKFVQDKSGKWLPKDCKDHYTLALLAPDDNGEGKLMTLNISATALRQFDKYIRTLAGMNKAPYEVVTEFTFDPDSDFPSVRCACVNDVPRSAIGFVTSCAEEAMKLVSLEPSVDDFEEKVASKRAPSRGAKGRKAA